VIVAVRLLYEAANCRSVTDDMRSKGEVSVRLFKQAEPDFKIEFAGSR